MKFGATVVAPATLTRQPVPTWSTPDVETFSDDLHEPALGPDWTLADGEERTIDRGVVSETDPSRFTCEYTTPADRRHSIEGSLSPDGKTLTFRYLAVAAEAGVPPGVKLGTKRDE